jgi:cell division protein FtsW
MAQVKTDWILFWTIVATVCFGILMVYSASSVMAAERYKNSLYFVERQMAWAAGSLFLMLLLMRFDYRRLRAPGWAFAPVGLLLVTLGVVYFADPHAHRWLRIGSFGIQPSEFAKPALILFLAYFVSLRKAAINDRHTLIPASLVVGFLSGIVMLGDVGTAIVLLAIAAVVFFAAGLEWKYILMAFAVAGLFVVVAVASRPYRLARVVTFVDPDFKIIHLLDRQDRIKRYLQTSVVTRDAGYHIKQSKIAVGDGGLAGRGLMNGKQKLFYLPEAHTDFIYAVAAEELGLWGASLVLLLFLVILWRGLKITLRTPNDFGRYVALGVTAMVVLQGLFNIGVVLGMLPTKGIPLPMISYGGSSLMSTLACLGLLLSVSGHSG